MLFRSLAFAMSLAVAAPAVAQMSDAGVAKASQEAVFGAPLVSDAAFARLRSRANPDVLPSLALALRYRGGSITMLETINYLAGGDAQIRQWHDYMLWLEGQPDLKAHPSYRKIKIDLMTRIDPRFARFIGEDRTDPATMDIRLSEIVWGGVRVDGIPSLDDPKMLPAAEADYLNDDDLVFGISINGDARAYPLRVLGWHEMMNDVVGGVPVALAYCTLCGSAILFETNVAGRDKPFVFGSSGFLYRSNKLMFDRETNSLWNQFTGKPVTGPLRGSGVELKVLPSATATWADWRRRHPNTTVASLDTGHDRDYGAGVVYQEYFASPDLMFPALVGDESVAKRKDFVFGVVDVAAARAWPVAAFAAEPVINDAIGARTLVLIGDAESRSVRAYDRGDHTFAASDAADRLTDASGAWRVTEDALIGPAGETLPRVAGRLAFWFAWDGYYGVESTLYQPKG